jgi:hypothetical protein
MTLYTKADLRNQALVALGVLDPTEAPSAQTIAHVDPIIQQMIEGLDDENVLIFDPSTDLTTAVIPGRIMLAMKELAAYELGPGYGRPQPYEAMLAAMARLRRSVLQGFDPIPASADFF